MKPKNSQHKHLRAQGRKSKTPYVFIHWLMLFDRCFITGEADAGDGGGVIRANIGEDPNVPKQGHSHIISLYAYDEAIPAHHKCLHAILPKVLAYESSNKKDWSESSIADFNLDVFYTCVEQSISDYLDTKLMLDYYEARDAVMRDWWRCRHGEEALLADPVDIPQLAHYYSHLPVRRPSAVVRRSFPTAARERLSSIFETLPIEIMTIIIEYLPTRSLWKLQVITPTITHAVTSVYFWKKRVRNDMPWLWDLPFNHIPSLIDVDWKTVYRDLYCRSSYGSSNAILGLVNRRRIWKSCRQLALLYAMQIQPAASSSVGILEGIQRHSVSRYDPLIAKERSDVQTCKTRTFFLSDWLDLNSKFTCIHTCWNINGRLVGLSVAMGRRPVRLCGAEPSETDTIKSTVLDPGDWIRGISIADDHEDGIYGLRVSPSYSPLLDCILFLYIALRLLLIPASLLSTLGLTAWMASKRA